MTGQPRRRTVQRLLSTSRHLLSQRIGGKLDLFFRVRAAAATASASFAQLYRYEPVHVGMLQRNHKTTRAAFTARFLGIALWCFTVNQLGKPQRETLLPDAAGARKQERLRQFGSGMGAG